MRGSTRALTTANTLPRCLPRCVHSRDGGMFLSQHHTHVTRRCYWRCVAGKLHSTPHAETECGAVLHVQQVWWGCQPRQSSASSLKSSCTFVLVRNSKTNFRNFRLCERLTKNKKTLRTMLTKRRGPLEPEGRTSRMVNPEVYKKGTMFVQCAHCEVRSYRKFPQLGLVVSCSR
jgi:ssDNA-binding Zn-finger/Zn-ribbon topoisomerase 1